METQAPDIRSTWCEHRWRYFVHLQSRTIRVRECEHCGKRAIVPVQLEPLPRHGVS
jgi:hypothetical protein